MKSALDTTFPVGQDLLCVGCRYNLRGAVLTGQCPECGQDVARSIAYAEQYGWGLPHPRWLLYLRLGAGLHLASVGYLAFMLLIVVLHERLGWAPLPWLLQLGAFGGLLFVVTLFLAAYPVLAREPGRPAPLPRAWRWVGWLTPPVLLACLLLSFFDVHVHLHRLGRLGLELVTYGALALLLTTQLAALRAAAFRVQAPRLARRLGFRGALALLVPATTVILTVTSLRELGLLDNLPARVPALLDLAGQLIWLAYFTLDATLTFLLLRRLPPARDRRGA